MRSSNLSKERQIREHGRIIARGIEDVKVEKKKNMMKAVTRKEKMLHDAAEQALSGNNSR